MPAFTTTFTEGPLRKWHRARWGPTMRLTRRKLGLSTVIFWSLDLVLLFNATLLPVRRYCSQQPLALGMERVEAVGFVLALGEL
mmetsp:Transcript_20865/g.50511  ORF Transcript_20865/g.50511 Transcript_20865/m.50511 type:complete len:84 (+) Transcript_20865:740-991(+)